MAENNERIMNEQLIKLHTKAYCMAFDEADDKNFHEHHINFFAELIVQHCIEGIKEWRDASDEHMDKEEYWKGYRSGCNDAIVEIMLRFKDEEN
jgi:hypothetical protein